jgi:hypothetical protein
LYLCDLGRSIAHVKGGGTNNEKASYRIHMRRWYFNGSGGY